MECLHRRGPKPQRVRPDLTRQREDVIYCAAGSTDRLCLHSHDSDLTRQQLDFPDLPSQQSDSPDRLRWQSDTPVLLKQHLRSLYCTTFQPFSPQSVKGLAWPHSSDARASRLRYRPENAGHFYGGHPESGDENARLACNQGRTEVRDAASSGYLHHYNLKIILCFLPGCSRMVNHVDNGRTSRHIKQGMRRL